MEDDLPEGFAVFDVPAEHRRRLQTSNLLERLNREIKRRTRVATLFPNEASLLQSSPRSPRSGRRAEATSTSNPNSSNSRHKVQTGCCSAQVSTCALPQPHLLESRVYSRSNSSRR